MIPAGGPHGEPYLNRKRLCPPVKHGEGRRLAGMIAFLTFIMVSLLLALRDAVAEAAVHELFGGVFDRLLGF